MNRENRRLPEIVSSGVCIVGLGLIGGSIVKALREYSEEIRITAVDRSEEPIRIALADHGIGDGAVVSDIEHVDRLLADAGLIIMSLYPAGMIRFLMDHSAALRPGTVVMDICGLKGSFVEEAQKAVPDGVEFIGTHPMAGREKTGYENGNAEMFLGATFILTPTERNTPETIRKMYSFARICGFARIRKVDPMLHDELIAYTSHLPHVLASVLMNSWEGDDEVIAYTGGSFRDSTRVADINTDLWTELFMMNSVALTKKLRDFSIEFTEFLTLMEASDKEGMKRFLERSGERRRRWTQALAKAEIGAQESESLEDSVDQDTAHGE